MYNTNLNYSQLKNQIETLTSQGLLAISVNKYIITEKGYRLSELFSQLNDLPDEFNPSGLGPGKAKLKSFDRDAWDQL